MSATVQEDIERRLATAEPDVEVLAAEVLNGTKVRVFIDHPEGVSLREGLLRAQAEVLGPDQVADHELLFRNRSLVLVRYAHTSAGAVVVHGELPPELVGPEWLDRLLGMLVDAAVVARHRAKADRPSPV